MKRNMATTSVSLSSPSLSSIFKPKLSHFVNAPNSRPLQFTSPSIITLSTVPSSKIPTIHSQNSPHQRTPNIWRIYATSEDIVPSDATPLENTQQIISTTNDDGVSTIISALLVTAFIGLSILTIGVIYIAVTDFLQKREREKFDKEEAAKKKKGGKKKQMRARAGPRGFGQKIDEDEFDED